MAIKLSVPEKNVKQLKPRILVIGVGGGGGNAVNNMINQNLEGVDFVVANTDAQALENSKASRKIQLGLETTQGLGAGAKPDIGKKAAEEAIEEIKKEIDGANMVFITAGMGGGTGSGASPVVAKVAKEMGALTVGVITKPFQFEGKKRSEVAELALEEFTNSVDSIIVIPNQNLFRIADKNTTLADAFIMADNVLYAGVRSITDLMMLPGLINLDFADVQEIMHDKGKAIMGTGEAEGEGRASLAAEQALANPLLDDCSMHGAKGVLINISGGQDITLFEIDEAVNKIKEQVDEDAQIIFGSSFDDSLKGKIRVSIVATGIDSTMAKKAPKPQPIVKEENFMPEPIKPVAPSEDLDSALQQFAAQKAPEKTAEESDPEVMEEEPPLPFAQPKTFDFDDLLDKSEVMEEMPKASSLFKAIINKSDDVNAEAQLSSALQAEENVFTAKTSLQEPVAEPELFPSQPSVVADARAEKPEELIVNDNERRSPTLIDILTGISIRKKNKHKEPETLQEPIYPSLSEDNSEDEAEGMNLDIPSFLRRK